MDEHARQTREASISHERRTELGRSAQALVDQAQDETELRFVVDGLRHEIKDATATPQAEPPARASNE